jgi:starch synthase
LLTTRDKNLSGIINGIDTAEWNPASDSLIARTYTREKLSGKSANKKMLQLRMGLDVAPDIPLFGAVSRFSHQKGYDIMLQIAPMLIKIPAQLVILGSGMADLEAELASLNKAYPTKVAVSIGFDEKLSHLIEAGADGFLMPSRFEPCGLNQMYSQRYGTPPVAHATGGLQDSIVDCTPATMADGSASGFLFKHMAADDFMKAIQRAVTVYHTKKIWRRLQKNGMAKDFSWHVSALSYREIYLSLLSQSE